jgi:hypothetical protein
MASLQKYATEDTIINETLTVFQSFNKSFTQTVDQQEIPIISMFWLVFRGFNISTQLMLQGHFSESYMVISRSAEATGYARKFQQDAQLVDIWFSKHKVKINEFKEKFGSPFPQNDTMLHPKIWDIYNLTRNYGSHSNFETTIFFTDTSKLKTDNRVNYEYSDFGEEINNRRMINYVIYCNHEFLKVFKEMFSAKLSDLWKNDLGKLLVKFENFKQTTLKPMFTL